MNLRVIICNQRRYDFRLFNLLAVIHTCAYNGIVRCVLSPHSVRGSFVYVQNFNSPEFFLVLTKYAMMSCVGLTSWILPANFQLTANHTVRYDAAN